MHIKTSTPAIAVIGMSCWYPGARDLQQLWENILARRQQFRRAPKQRLPSEYYDPDFTVPDKTYGNRMAVIDGFKFDWVSKRIPKTVVESADIAHWVALEVALKAFEDAGYTRQTVATERTGVLLGNTLTGEFSRSTNLRLRWPYVRRALIAAATAQSLPSQVIGFLAETVEDYYKSVFSPITEDTLSGNLSNTIAGRICNFFNFHGGGYTVDGACASSLIAVANAATSLTNGDLDLALAGGVDISLDSFELVGFAKTGALTSQDMLVYDRKASGFIPGEGCGFVVLKRLADARAHGDYVYAVLHGWGISSDGKGGLTAPSREGQAKALCRAYDRAGYRPCSVDFMEGHGTGTPIGDQTELEGMLLAINSYGEAEPRSCGVTSFKSLVGHTKAAAGVGALIKAVMAVNRRVLPPLAGCKEPNAVFESFAHCLYPILQGEVRKQTNILTAGVSAMGFGGINCHVTLKSGDAPAAHLEPSIAERSLLVSRQETELFAFSAASVADLLGHISAVIVIAEGLSLAELVDLACHLTYELKPQLPIRATAIAGTPEELIERLNLLEKLLRETPPAQGEVIVSPAQEIWVGNAVRQNRVGFLFPGQGSQQLNMARSLVERYGWAQKLVEQAEKWLHEVGVQGVREFVYPPLDRAANQEQVEEWLRALARTEVAQPAICLASLIWMRYLNRLGIKPVAVGGHSLGELSAFHAAGAFDEEALLRLAAIRGQAMSVSANSNRGATKHFSQSELLPETLSETTIPVFSSVDGQQLAPGLSLCQHFTHQLIAPVNFGSLVNTLTRTCNLLVEVGPGKVLSDLVSDIASPNGPHCLPVESKPGLDQDLNVVLAALFVRGSDINWQALYENRLVHPFVPASERIFIENPLERPFQVPTLRASPSPNMSETLHARPAKQNQVPWELLSKVPELVPMPDTPTNHDQASRIENLLVSLIAQQTGFPQASITPEIRLLDDLNLDSIKAGEVLASAAKEFGVAGKIDPASYANAAIQEVAEAIRIAMPSTISKEATPELIAQVRDFIVEAVPESSTPVLLGRYLEENWKAANVLILCDEGNADFAKALCDEFRSQGSPAQTTSFAKARSEELTNSIDFTHFIAVFPCIPSGETSDDALLLRMIERLSSLAAIPLASHAAREHTTVAYVQFGGGYFGIKPQIADIEQCCAVGFASSLHLERPDLKVRVLDFSPNVKPCVLAACVLSELSTQHVFLAVGYDEQLTRCVPRPQLQEPASYRSRAIIWSPDDVMLVTGGAKGITAECALALARDTGVRMALVGRSPHPDEDSEGRGSTEIRTLARFSQEGLTCRYYACDIADSNSVTTIVQRVRQDLGEITGVIHGAALNWPRRVAEVSTASALAEVGPKLKGVLNLHRALQDKPLKLFAAMSSVIGVTGMQRNAWYGFSNEALDLIMRRFAAHHSETAVLSTAFSVWEEVGMGMRMGSVQRLGKMGISAIPKHEGTRRFLRLVKNDPGNCQVLVAAAMRTRSAFDLGGFDTWSPPLFSLPAASRFLEQLLVNEPGVKVVSRAHLSLERDLYLQDHVYKGSYLFPTVFGLEAMAQAVAYATGEQTFPTLRIQDIRLDRPIVVDPPGVDIEIQAVVFEREFSDSPRQIRASIRTAQTGFAIEHFSANFILGSDSQPSIEQIELPEVPLDIQPQEDLYSWLLFQGPLFQRLQQIYRLDSKKFVFGVELRASSSASKDSFPDQPPMPLLLGDPYFRDALLQSAQVVVPKDLCLPVRIDSIELYQTNHESSGIRVGVVLPQGQNQREYSSTVFAVDQDGQIVERLNGYVTRVLEHREDNPTAEEIADSSQRDQRLLRSQLSEQTERFDLLTPEILLAYIPSLHLLPKQERRQRELPLLSKAVSLALNSRDPAVKQVRFSWSESGKPIIEGVEGTNLDVSLSHDRRVCICVAGQGRQGCDIEPIVPRTWLEWIGLLSNVREPILQELIASTDTLARAGTRIWVVVEALRKAINTGEIRLEIDSCKTDAVLFNGIVGNQRLQVLSFPLQLTRGPERMVASVMHSVNSLAMLRSQED